MVGDSEHKYVNALSSSQLDSLSNVIVCVRWLRFQKEELIW